MQEFKHMYIMHMGGTIFVFPYLAVRAKPPKPSSIHPGGKYFTHKSILGNVLQCLAGKKPKECDLVLPQVEFPFNRCHE